MILDFELYSFELMLEESLTFTYPTDIVVKYIKRKFGLTEDDIDIDEDDFILVHQDIKTNNEELYNKIEHILISSGYYVGKIEEPAIVFEKKFEKNIFDELKSSGEIKYLYHVSPSINDKKILSKGLIPKSKNYRFNYPDRIYLFSDKNLLNDKYFLENMCELLYNSIKHNSNIIKYNIYSVFRIDFEKINNIILCKDKNAYNFEAFYTTDNLNPNLIEKIKEIKL